MFFPIRFIVNEGPLRRLQGPRLIRNGSLFLNFVLQMATLPSAIREAEVIVSL